MKQKPYESIKKELKNCGHSLEFMHNETPKCPHCGYELPCLTDYSEIMNDGEHEIECPECDLTFDVSTNVEITFSTDRIPDEFK